MYKLIIVDDEPQISSLLMKYFNKLKDDSGQVKFDVAVFNGGNACIEYIESGGKADLILSDMRMPEGGGIDILKYLNDSNNKIPLFFMTGFAGDINLDDVINMGAKKIFQKPFKLLEIAQELEKAINF